MKRIIDGKTYNTETATTVCDTGNDLSVTDFRHEDSALYITKKGAFFIAGNGGPMSRFARAESQNSWSGGGGVIPLDRGEAVRCAENWPEQIEEYFGDMIEDA
jgi:hypothetical protein